MTVRIEEVGTPFVANPESIPAAARLLSRAEMFGALAPGVDARVLDYDLIASVLDGLSRQGVSAAAALRVRAGNHDPSAIMGAIDSALEESEHSPMPAGEWPTMIAIVGVEMLALLVDAGESSIRRYAGGGRATPHDVADRLHTVALIVADLAGSYNDYGMRRWFTRTRPQLEGRAPIDVLSRAWSSSDADVQRVRGLAADLVGA